MAQEAYDVEITMEQVGELLGVSAVLARRAARSGKLTAWRVGRKWRTTPRNAYLWYTNPDTHKLGRR